MPSRPIREKGQRSLAFVSYAVTIFFMVTAFLPLAWMFVSSLKDNASIDAFPPTLLPKAPYSVTVTLDYSGQAERTRDEYETDAMKATWYSWMTNLRENVGQLTVRGTKDGKLLYKATTISANFYAGQPSIVPSTFFNEKQMELKLPIIRQRELSSFVWYEPPREAGALPGNSDSEIGAKFRDFFTETGLVDGHAVAISESRDWVRMFDSYLSLSKVAQDTAGSLGFFRYFLNSSIVTAATIACQLLLGGLAGYALSYLVRSPRMRFWLIMYFLATIMIPDVAIILPLYLMMQQLNLVDTLWAIILPHTAWGFVIFLFKGFFDQLPGELLQAARIDGASEARTFSRIVLPMSIPIFTIVAIMTFLPVWNEFMWPLIATKTPTHWTFTVALNDLQSKTAIRQNSVMASAAVSMVPLLVLFSFTMKYIERGITFSGVKG